MRPPETRQTLIVRLCSQQDEAAWREFVTAYEPFLSRLVARQGVPEHHLPDVTQQIFLAIARSVEKWRPDGQGSSFRRGLSTVARHVVIRFMTRERRQSDAPGGTDWLEQLQALPQLPSDDTEAGYQHELIVWAAEQVRHEFLETSWKAFQATVIEGQSVPEVAAALGISSGSIYMSRSRIMSRIRHKVQEVEDR